MQQTIPALVKLLPCSVYMAGVFIASEEEKFQGWKVLPGLFTGISAGLSNENTPHLLVCLNPEELHPEYEQAGTCCIHRAFHC